MFKIDQIWQFERKTRLPNLPLQFKQVYHPIELLTFSRHWSKFLPCLGCLLNWTGALQAELWRGFKSCIFIICFISPLAIHSKLPEVPQAEIWCRFLLELLTRAPIPAGISPEVVPRLTKLHACRGMPHHGRGQLRCAQPKRNGSLIFFHCLAIPISLPLVLVWYLSFHDYWLLGVGCYLIDQLENEKC